MRKGAIPIAETTFRIGIGYTFPRDGKPKERLMEFRNLLAECPGLGSVTVCSCGSVHVRIGPVELTLEPEAFAQSALMFQRAAEALEAGKLATSDTRLAGRAKGSQLTH